MIVDACRNQLPTGKGVDGIGSNTKSLLAESDGLAVIFSCASSERSYEIDPLEQSSFTHCLLNGIKDPGTNTLQQAADYLATEVKILNNKYGLRPQEPYLVARPDALKQLQVFALLALAKGSYTIDDYFEFLKDLWAREEIKASLYLDVYEFLQSPSDQARMRAVRELHGLQLSIEEFEKIWKSLRGPAPRRAPENPVEGTNGKPPGGRGANA
jgi:hypothetical protein